MANTDLSGSSLKDDLNEYQLSVAEILNGMDLDLRNLSQKLKKIDGVRDDDRKLLHIEIAKVLSRIEALEDHHKNINTEVSKISERLSKLEEFTERGFEYISKGNSEG